MTKGKHAASQNAKKLLLAEERIAELERALSAVIEAAHLKEQDLMTEIQVLGNRLVSDVQSLAADKIDLAKKEAEMRVRQSERFHRDSVIAAFRYLNEKGEARLSMQGWGEVAAILKVDSGELVTLSSGEHHNRNARRANRAYVNATAQLMEQPNTGIVRRGR
jgi:hypothetical protein